MEQAASFHTHAFNSTINNVNGDQYILNECRPDDLLVSFISLMDNVSVLVKVGDELATIHPCVHEDWNVVSVGLKLLQAQQIEEKKIANLIRAIECTYSAVLALEKLREDALLQGMFGRVWGHTITCSIFVQGCAGRLFAGRSITVEFSGTDELAAKFTDSFERLRKKFTLDITIKKALRHKTPVIDIIKRDQILAYLKPAELNEDKRNACLPNTRLGAIKSIMDWFTDESADRKAVMWLYGLAGTGKSTLSTTIVWMMREAERLGACFFFSRDFPERNAATLIRTLAYQLAQFDARIGAEILQVIESTPNIAGMSLAVQFTKLLSANALGGIEWPRGPILVVIDALDESSSEKDREGLVRVLSEGFLTLPAFIRLLIVSRPERDIRDQFERPHICLYELSVNSPTSQPDITMFIRHRLDEIRKANKYLALAADWPGDDNIDGLVNGASGLFIWASTACLYIDSHDPRTRLYELTKQESADTSINPFANLHRLYEVALQSAGRWDDRLFCEDVQAILGVILCARIPLSHTAIDSLLVPPRPSLQSISRIGSVLYWNETEAVRILHTSFHDYLTLHCRADPWAISIEQHNAQLAGRCISLLDKELRQNICGLTLAHPVRDESLTEAVSYASTFWIEHVCLVSDVSRSLGDQIYSFLCRHLLHWMEALAIVKSHGVAIRSLQNLLKWIKGFLPENKDLYHFVYDAHRFAQYFASTIEEHPLLIYVTALPFTPCNTLIYHEFNHNDLPQVICGVEMTWPPQLQILCGHGEEVRSVAFSLDGSKIVSGSDDGMVRVWDAVTGQAALPPLQGHDGHVTSVAFSPDGGKIISGSDDATVRVWDAVTGKVAMPPLRGHDSHITSVAFSFDGSRIVSGSNDETVQIWDAATGKAAMPSLEGHDNWVTSASFSPNGSKIVSASDDTTVRVWDAITGEAALPPLRGHDSPVTCVAFSPDGSKIASGSHNKAIRVWDAFTGKETLPPLQGHDDWVTSVAFSPDGTKIVSGSDDATVRVWDAITGKAALSTFRGHEYGVRSVAFSPDGTKIVSGSNDETVRVWDAVTGTAALHKPQGHDNWVTTVAFSPDGSKIASGSYDKTVRVWDAATGKQALPPLRGHYDKVTSVAFSPDGFKIVSGSWDKTVRVWDVVTGKEALPRLRGHYHWVTSVAFSPDGLKIISGSWDKTVRVWDAVTGASALRPLWGHKGRVTSVAFSFDGSEILSGSDDKTVLVWDATDGSLKHSDCDLPLPDQVQTSPIRSDERGFFVHSESGRHLGKLPLGFSYYHARFYNSYFVGWTSHHKIVIIRFPS